MKEKPTHEEIYEKLSSLFNIKFKAQLKDSPIVFDNFLQIKNVVLENENYAILFLREKEILKFRDKKEFVDNFISFIDIKIGEFNREFENLQNFERMSMGIKYDENEVYMRHETIGHGIMKLNQIRDKLSKVQYD
ncbi:hypothetical protein SY27_15260 [Flavobacterium sp. 316]|uniref:hypothetical protein n=1 Tax=Flavobacterium sp. 316 TaxID=1603293 RepID=UPI0005E3C63F|nr:hypothetical protein [Flavobacterium sp. 316]KIX19889.1 hypothetical protein SY27_15260 [Flavobacterium sp. 316]